MGCDGGTIPKRDELVRTKKKKEKVSIFSFFCLIKIFIYEVFITKKNRCCLSVRKKFKMRLNGIIVI